MIQRIQSVWLLIAALGGAAMYKLPLWTGKHADGSTKDFNGAENLLLFITIIAVTALALFTIFMFKDRKTQKALCWLGFLLSLALLAMEYFMVDGVKKASAIPFESNTWKLGAILPIVMMVLFQMARTGIRRDEKLLRSLDKLR
jgi:4-hydroxybenzoate polyprenyltransferase